MGRKRKVIIEKSTIDDAFEKVKKTIETSHNIKHIYPIEMLIDNFINLFNGEDGVNEKVIELENLKKDFVNSLVTM